MPLQLAFGLNTGAVSEYLLFEGISYCLGSSPEADIVISHSQISGYHATFSADLPDYTWQLTDSSGAGFIKGGVTISHSEISSPAVVHFGTAPCSITNLSLDDVAENDCLYFRRKQQLRHIEKSLHSTSDNVVMTDLVCDYMKRMMGCERAVLLLLDDNDQIEHTTGFQTWMTSVRNKRSRSLITHCIQTKSPVIVGNVARDHSSENGQIAPDSFSSALCVPIMIENEIAGVVYGDNTKHRQYFTQTEVKLTQSLANILAMRILLNSIVNSKFYLTKV